MQLPTFIKETFAAARQHPLWGTAFFAALLLPVMLIYVRTGIEICSGVIGLGFLWHSWRVKDWAWLRSPFMLATLVAWLWLVLVVTPLAVDPRAGLTEALVWFRLPLLFASLRYWVLREPAARTTLGGFLGVVLALVALDCCWQFATGVSLSGHHRLAFDRLTGPFAGPKVGAYIAQLALPLGALCLSAALASARRRYLGLTLGLLALLLAAVVMSGERSAFLTLLLGSATALGLLMLTEKRLRLAGCAAVILVGVMVTGLYLTSPAVQLRGRQMLSTMEHYRQSDYGQLAAVGLTLGEEHPLHGVGLHGYRLLCPPLEAMGVEFRGMHPHNFYLEWFAEAGLPGLLLFLAMLGLLLRETLQPLRAVTGLQRLVPAMAIGVMVQHFFPLVGMQSFFTNWGAMLQWYSLSVMFAALPRREASPAMLMP